MTSRRTRANVLRHAERTAPSPGKTCVIRESTMSVLHTTVRPRPVPHTYIVPVVREIAPKRPDLAWTTW
jgi:hypothetical protein